MDEAASVKYSRVIKHDTFLFSAQAIFDRNRKDELPRLQLEWIDSICMPLYQVIVHIAGAELKEGPGGFASQQKKEGGEGDDVTIFAAFSISQTLCISFSSPEA